MCNSATPSFLHITYQIVIQDLLHFNKSFAEAYGSSVYGIGTGSIMMDNVACKGNEKDIGDCIFGGWTKHDCSHSEDVGVSCGK